MMYDVVGEMIAEVTGNVNGRIYIIRCKWWICRYTKSGLTTHTFTRLTLSLRRISRPSWPVPSTARSLVNSTRSQADWSSIPLAFMHTNLQIEWNIENTWNDLLISIAPVNDKQRQTDCIPISEFQCWRMQRLRRHNIGSQFIRAYSPNIAGVPESDLGPRFGRFKRLIDKSMHKVTTHYFSKSHG
jgi:hypothetical protein